MHFSFSRNLGFKSKLFNVNSHKDFFPIRQMRKTKFRKTSIVFLLGHPSFNKVSSLVSELIHNLWENSPNKRWLESTALFKPSKSEFNSKICMEVTLIPLYSTTGDPGFKSKGGFPCLRASKPAHGRYLNSSESGSGWSLASNHGKPLTFPTCFSFKLR